MRTLFLVLAAHGLLSAGVSVTSRDYDNANSGANTQETVLTPAILQGGKFGKICTFKFAVNQDRTWGQVLIDDGVGPSGHPIAITATNTNKVYGFDAYNCAPVWSVSLGAPYIVPPTSFTAEIVDGIAGVASTPVLDASAHVVYVMSHLANGTYKLFAFNTADGSQLHASPSAIIAGSNQGITFDGTEEYQRPALKLSGGLIFALFGSYSDDSLNWYGWIVTLSATTLAQQGIWVAEAGTPGGSAFWASGGGPSFDNSGNVIAPTGNNQALSGCPVYSETVVKLDPTLATLLDHFTPANCSTLNLGDLDLATSRTVTFNSGLNTLIIGKDPVAYVLTNSSMGTAAQSFVPGQGYATFNNYAVDPISNTLYLTGGYSPDGLWKYTWTGSAFTTPGTVGPDNYTYANSTLTISSNAGASGIVWRYGQYNPTTASSWRSQNVGVLRAYDATTLALLWTSEAQPGDAVGNWARWVPATVANGYGYAASSTALGGIVVYGVRP